MTLIKVNQSKSPMHRRLPLCVHKYAGSRKLIRPVGVPNPRYCKARYKNDGSDVDPLPPPSPPPRSKAKIINIYIEIQSIPWQLTFKCASKSTSKTISSTSSGQEGAVAVRKPRQIKKNQTKSHRNWMIIEFNIKKNPIQVDYQVDIRLAALASVEVNPLGCRLTELVRNSKCNPPMRASCFFFLLLFFIFFILFYFSFF